MWLKDNRNVHASAKIKYGNMKIRWIFFFLSQRTDSLVVAEITWEPYFLSSPSQKNKIEKKEKVRR